jgi:hypothetical protein
MFLDLTLILKRTFMVSMSESKTSLGLNIESKISKIKCAWTECSVEPKNNRSNSLSYPPIHKLTTLLNTKMVGYYPCT